MCKCNTYQSDTVAAQFNEVHVYVTHTSCIADHKGKHDAEDANIFHKNGT